MEANDSDKFCDFVRPFWFLAQIRTKFCKFGQTKNFFVRICQKSDKKTRLRKKPKCSMVKNRTKVGRLSEIGNLGRTKCKKFCPTKTQISPKTQNFTGWRPPVPPSIWGGFPVCPKNVKTLSEKFLLSDKRPKMIVEIWKFSDKTFQKCAKLLKIGQNRAKSDKIGQAGGGPGKKFEFLTAFLSEKT